MPARLSWHWPHYVCIADNQLEFSLKLLRSKQHGPTPTHIPINSRDYLAWEVEQAGKHEYYYGEVFAMKNKPGTILTGTILTMNGDLSAKTKIT